VITNAQVLVTRFKGRTAWKWLRTAYHVIRQYPTKSSTLEYIYHINKVDSNNVKGEYVIRVTFNISPHYLQCLVW